MKEVIDESCRNMGKGALNMSGRLEGGFLRKWRRERGLTQERLARVLGVSRVCVAYWETGKREIPAIMPWALLGLEKYLTTNEAAAELVS
jgi:predicted transcriptional regulator